MKSCPTCQKTYPDDFSLCPRDGAALVEAAAWAEGAVVRGKYRILAKLGQGGMGAVYKAVHLRFNEVRALKVMSPQVAGDPLFVKRFEQEAVITRKLQHPNAVRVDDIDETDDGRPFIVMEFIEGKSLQKVIESEGPLPVPRVCAIIKQVAAALGAAHELGMVHRDIKPDNIVLVAQGPQSDPAAFQEQAKVLDFGIAKLKEVRATEGARLSLTGTGIVIGTPEYMSPEQAAGKRGDELDGRSDLYSLGIVMYEMLSGRLPFKSDTPMGMLVAHMHTPPKPIREARPDLRIPDAIANLVMRCLEKTPERRPASAAALIAELERAERQPAAPLAPTRIASPAPAGAQARPAAPRAVPRPAVQIRTAERSQRGLWVGAFAGAVVLGLTVWHFSSRPAPRNPSGSESTPAQQSPPTQQPAGQSTAPAVSPESGTTETARPTGGTAKPPPPKPAASQIDSGERQKQINAAKTEGDLYYENGEYDNAIAAYQNGLKVDPTNAELLQKIQKARNAKATETEFSGALTGTKGELTGAIARKRDELVALAHRADRDYFEFNVRGIKGQQKVGGVTIQLIRTNLVKNSYVVNLQFDDASHPHKEHTTNEPIYFYVQGASSALELVVNKIAKDSITGYLSTPKGLFAGAPNVLGAH